MGINLGGWLGIHAGISEDFYVFAGAQITPFVHVGGSVGLDGIGISIGVDFEAISADFEVKLGWRSVLAIAALYFGIPIIVDKLPLIPGSIFPYPAYIV